MRTIAVLLGIILPVALAEIGLRLFYPEEKLIAVRQIDDALVQAKVGIDAFEADPQIGHRPCCGGRCYDRFGLLRGFWPRDAAAAKVPGTTRVLWLGDSVTIRATIVTAARELCGGDRFEMLNAGAEGWNPIQEIAFYFRCQQELAPDHIVLTLHNNDLTYTTTALFVDGELTLCNPGNLVALRPDLYRASWLYRLFVSAQNRYPWTPAGYVRLATEVEAALQRLRDHACTRQARLTVILLPILAPERTWQPHERRSRELALAMLARLQIPTIDLLPACEQLLAAGVPMRSPETDLWHPSRIGGAQLAAHAIAHGLFGLTAADFLGADALVLPPATPQELRIDAGPEHAGRHYRIVGSAGLSADAIEFAGARSDLVPDAWMEATLRDRDEVLMHGEGVLDAGGRGTAWVRAPRLDPQQQWWCRWHTCIVFAADGTAIARVSRPVPMLVVR
jgi:hypothetical protein